MYSKKSKSILFIAYTFPPYSDIGSYRLRKFSKYFQKRNWNVFVAHPKYIDRQAFYDGEMYKTYKKKVYIITTKSLSYNTQVKIKRLKFLKNILRWCFFGIIPILKLIKKNQIRYIYCSFPPLDTFIIGFLISIFTESKVIFDLRDPLLDSGFKHHLIYKKIIEKILFNKINIIIVLTNYVKKYYSSIFPKKICEIIPNGYDRFDYINRKENINKQGEKFIITYTGSIDPPSRPIHTMVLALKELISEKKINRNEILLRLVGKIDDESKSICENELKQNVEIIPYVSYKKSVKYIQQTTILLLIMAGHNVRNAYKGVIPGKAFQYLGSNKIILTLTDLNGPTALLINQTNSGITMGIEDVIKIKKNILILYKAWKSGKKILPKSRGISKYDFKNLVTKLDSILIR